MIRETINLKDAMKTIRSGEPFSVVFVTSDRKRKTGGEIIEIPAAVCSKLETDSEPKPASGKNVLPNHRENNTINIKIISSNKVRKVKVRLITSINGKKVVY